MTLFCPQNHLLLQRRGERVERLRVCPHCGWQAPTQGPVGEVLWRLDAPSWEGTRRLYAQPAAWQRRALLPLARGEIWAIHGATGKRVWRATVGTGRHLTRVLRVGNAQVWALLIDNDPLGEQHGLALVNPKTGAHRVVFTSPVPLSGLEPVASDVVTRSARGVFRLTPGEPEWRERWRVPETDSWLLPPVVTSRHVGFLAGGRSVFVDVNSGRVVAQATLPDALRGAALRGAAWDERFVWTGERARAIWAVHATTGETLWLQPAARVYTPPVVDGARVWVAVRGAAPRGQKGHYLLWGLDTNTGQVLLEVPLPRRVLLPTLPYGTLLFLFDDEGFVVAVDPEQGAIAWELPVSANGVPPGMALLGIEHVLIAGAYDGQVVGIQIARSDVAEASPDEWLAAGAFETAAEAYALQGDFRRAAQVLAAKLQRPRQALALLEFGELWAEALRLAQAHEWYDEVERLAAKTQNLALQAEARERRGDPLGAARLWEQYGRQQRDAAALEHAAELYEQAGAKEDAWRLRKALGQVSYLEQVIHFIKQTLSPEDLTRDLARYAEEKGPLAAGHLALREGLYRWAVDYFHKAALEARQRGDAAAENEAYRLEEQALAAYVQGKPPQEERWAWERLAALARRRGAFAEEARAWEQLDEDVQAADAYWRAAMQAERNPDRASQQQAAFFYERFLALQGYDLDEDIEWLLDMAEDPRIKAAWEKILQLRRWPFVVIETIEPKRGFREGEFNTLKVRMVNRGYDRAEDVQVTVVNDDLFEMRIPGHLSRSRLPRHQGVDLKIWLRPKEGVVGDAVPITFRWSWKDRHGRHRTLQTVSHIKVHHKGSRSIGTPHIINIYGGSAAIGEGASAYHGSTHVEGDYVKGDQLTPGAQKGDRVEIHRGGPAGSRIVLSEEAEATRAAARECPVCHLPVPPDGRVCPHCGNALPPAAEKAES